MIARSEKGSLSVRNRNGVGIAQRKSVNIIMRSVITAAMICICFYSVSQANPKAHGVYVEFNSLGCDVDGKSSVGGIVNEKALNEAHPERLVVLMSKHKCSFYIIRLDGIIDKEDSDIIERLLQINVDKNIHSGMDWFSRGTSALRRQGV